MAASEIKMETVQSAESSGNDLDYQTTDIDNVIQNDNKNAKHTDFIENSLIDYEAALPVEYYDKKIKIDIKTAKQLSGKQYLLIIPITRFFQNVRNMYVLINILNGRSIISLRLIEYFVVNYVLENNTYFDAQKYKSDPGFIVNHMMGTPMPSDESAIKSPAEQHEDRRAEIRAAIRGSVSASPTSNFDNYFLVHDNYKSQLKEYNKKNFDPFCRWNRIRVYFDTKKYFYTTVAQLNFFKWAIENHVLDYILDSLDTIETAMNEYEKAIKLEKKVRKINLLRQQNHPDSDEDQPLEPVAVDESSAVCAAVSEVPGQHLGVSQEATNNQEDPITTSDALQMDGPIRRTKKRDVAPAAHPDKRSKLRYRKKKEFTKTNRSIIKYDCVKIINFD